MVKRDDPRGVCWHVARGAVQRVEVDVAMMTAMMETMIVKKKVMMFSRTGVTGTILFLLSIHSRQQMKLVQTVPP